MKRATESYNNARHLYIIAKYIVSLRNYCHRNTSPRKLWAPLSPTLRHVFSTEKYVIACLITINYTTGTIILHVNGVCACDVFVTCSNSIHTSILFYAGVTNSPLHRLVTFTLISSWFILSLKCWMNKKIGIVSTYCLYLTMEKVCHFFIPQLLN